MPLSASFRDKRSSGASAETGSGALLSSGLLILTFVTLNSGSTSGGGSLLLEGSGNDVSGYTELLNEVLNTLVGDGVVSPLPREDLLEEALRLEGLDDHLNVEVGNSKLLVLGEVGVLLDDNNTLAQQIFVDLSLVLLRYQNHFCTLFRLVIYSIIINSHHLH